MKPPSTGRKLPFLAENERRALVRWRASDRKDPFSADPNDAISELGRIALHAKQDASIDRQFVVDAYFGIGDMCAERVLQDEEMLVFYAGKVLIAYEQAFQQAKSEVDRMQAENAIGQFLDWVLHVAHTYSTERNIAVALWVGAYQSEILTPHPTLNQRMLNALLMKYAPAQQGGDDVTHFDQNLTPMSQFGGEAKMTDGAGGGGGSPTAFASYDEQTRVADSDENLSALSLFDAKVPTSNFPMSTYQGELEQSSEEGTVFDEHRRGTSDQAGLQSVEEAFAPLEDLKAPLYRRTPREAKAWQNDFEVGQRMNGRYEVVDYRTGGMGIVYLCYDHDQHAPVAIKSFQRRFLENERAVARFEQEAYAWIRLDKHPNIVQARLIQTIKERPHIILEHVSPMEGMGVDLRHWIDKTRLPLGRALLFALQIAWAMRHATERIEGLVHRDIKPANILISHDGTAKVTDFGLVRSISSRRLRHIESDVSLSESDADMLLDDERLTRDNAMVGTPPYMSPEQCLAEEVDERADIYAFGVVLYEMLTGRHPFNARGMNAWREVHLYEMPIFDEDAVANVPSDVRAFVLMCLKKKREERPQSWQAVESDLTALHERHIGDVPVIDTQGTALELRELMDKGYSLTELGRYDEAIIAYDDALALDPTYAWAWARKGRTLRLLNAYEGALRCYDRALEIHPTYAWALAGKGIILDRLNRPAEALGYFEKATEANGDDVWYWYNRGNCLQALNRNEEALDILKKGLEVQSSHSSTWAKIGQIYRLQGNYAQAVEAYKQAVIYDATYSWALNGLGLSYKALGNIEEAVIAFKQACTHEASIVWHWYNLADALIQGRMYREALQAIESALKLDAHHAPSWGKLGQIRRYLHELDSALIAYDRAIALDDAFDWALNGRGIVLEQLGRYDEALTAYEEAISIKPTAIWYWYNHAKVLTTAGRFKAGLESIEKALSLDPEFGEAWGLKGRLKRELGAYDEALLAGEQAVTLSTNYAWGWYELGMTHEYQKASERALEAYRKAGQMASNVTHYVYKQAEMLLELRHYDEALTCLQRALTLNNRNAIIWAKHGQALRKLKRFQEALTSYTRALNLDPDYSWAWSGHGLTLSALGQHREALVSFRRALALEKDDLWYWYNYAEELFITEAYMEALEAIEEALEINTRHVESWAKYGQILRTIGRYEDSLKACDKALELDPDYAWGWNGRGLTLRLLGRYKEALDAYEKALQLDPQMIWYTFNQVTALLDMGRLEEALLIAERALTIDKQNSIGWGRHGQVLRRLERFEEAIISYDKALELDNTYAWAWNGRGMCLGKGLKRWEEAVECFKRAVHYNPRDVWFWHNYGEALEKCGDLKKAEYAFQRGLELMPKHVQTLEKLGDVQQRLQEQAEQKNDSQDE